MNFRIPDLVVATLFGLAAFAANPQDRAPYPAKPVKLIVNTLPGSPPDVLARLLGDKLASSLGQAVVIENRTGGIGMIGLNAVAKAPPDGYTLGILTLPNIVGPSLIARMPFDIEKDLTPVSLFARDANLLVVPSGAPARSVAELIALAKAQPGVLKFASGGISTPAHLAGELFKREAGVDIVHIPYNSAVLGASAVLTGDVDMMFGATLAVSPHVKSGKLRALATTAARRIPAYPDVSTLVELGYANVAFSGWFGVVAPAGTPKETVTRLHLEIRKFGALQETRQRLEAIGLESTEAGPEEFAAYMRSELRRWNKVVRDAGIKAD
ncbi:MAG: tripartite tricarboxylate transporter substrate binding protein [Betaproteobacteria bacterium]|nr:tripartite tricarboxylate transporter substrate binding protein [Betaproteobacteria bacterium]